VDRVNQLVSFKTKVLGLFRVTVDRCPIEQIYGTYSKEVELLRHFRDRVLSRAPAGQEITRLYYKWSPSIVTAMKEDDGFKKTIKALLDGILPLVEEEVE